METLNRLNLTDLITASRAHAHTARRLAKAHRRSRVRSRPPHTQRLQPRYPLVAHWTPLLVKAQLLAPLVRLPPRALIVQPQRAARRSAHLLLRERRYRKV